MSRLFAACCGLIGLHVLLVELVVLEPGASRADHLAAALVPLAVLIVAALAYPRVRAGAGATLALSIGALTVVGGALAVARLGVQGMDPSAVTGLILVPSGLALLALGTRGLWTSRKPGGRVVLRRMLLGLGALVFVYWVEIPIALALVATHRPAEPVEPADLGHPSSEVKITTDDGLELSGRYVPSRNGAAIVTFPDTSETAEQATMLADHGYGVLTLDMRGYGGSEGDPNAYGWGAAEDIDAAVGFLDGREDVDPDRIGGLGLSVGGEQMIEAAAGDPAIRAVVSEGAGERSIRETLLHGPAAALVIPQAAVLTAATAVFSGEPPPPALDTLAARISPRALFLITAERGQGGEELNEDYFAAAGKPKQLWEVPDADHTGGIDVAPDEYENRVVGFFDRYLLGKEG